MHFNPRRSNTSHAKCGNSAAAFALLCRTIAFLAPFSASAAYAQSYTLTTLASFDFTDGDSPYAGLTLSADGATLYGTTVSGGANNHGTVFSVPAAGGTPKTLVDFGFTDGANPYAGLTLSTNGTTLYGTASQGGASYSGTVFSVPVGGGTPTSLVSFNNTDGATPDAGLTLSADGTTLYGTASQGGADSDGIVFSVPVGGGTSTTLATFDGTNGQFPTAGLILSADGATLYGTTSQGGTKNDGTVFSVPVGGGTPTTLVSFTGTNGSSPNGLVLSGTTLYGTTSGGGASSDGTVFSVPVTGGKLTTLASFNNTNGALPLAGPTLSADGATLYGTTESGGTDNDGTVFSVPVGGGTLTILVTFNGDNGQYPAAGLTLSRDGTTLYGTTMEGGADGDGTVFALSSVHPILTSLSPSSKPAESSAFTLTVNGTGFTSNSVVDWNGTALTTTFVSSTKLTAFVSASLLHHAGTFPVTVTTPGAATSNSETFTITAAGVTVQSLTVAPTSVKGGVSSTGTITLTGPAPAGGLAVKQTSSDASAATLAPTLNIAAGATSAKFKITTYAVASTQTVTITSSVNGSSKTATLTVTGTPPLITIAGLSLSPASVQGGSATSTGTITLTGPAPSGGLAVTQTSSNTSAATLAPTLNIPAGATSAKFKITTYAVTSTKTVTIMSSVDGSSKMASLTVTH